MCGSQEHNHLRLGSVLTHSVLSASLQLEDRTSDGRGDFSMATQIGSDPSVSDSELPISSCLPHLTQITPSQLEARSRCTVESQRLIPRLVQPQQSPSVRGPALALFSQMRSS